MTIFSIPRPTKFYPNWGFRFENKPSGNPVYEHSFSTGLEEVQHEDGDDDGDEAGQQTEQVDPGVDFMDLRFSQNIFSQML
jgi:hypothetical protein